ncbi:PDZ and LIM domain protein Zasp-like [Macrobrachium rosenbergii]|uniref:PDZ and LIM domain protein Zasp-like n=1 Tax=Macrobrachium rosenbergii TaxID=79674 RepID=UPI0034D6DD20
MILLVFSSLLIVSAFAQREGLSLAQQRVRQRLGQNGQPTFSQVFDLPQQPVILQDQVIEVQEPVLVQDAFDNQRNVVVNQRRLTTFQEQQQRRRLEQEARQQEERIRQQQLALQRAEARRRAQEQNTLRVQNQQQQQQNTQRVQNVLANRQLQTPVLTQTVIGPVAQTLDDQRDGPFQDGTYYFRYATSDGIEREEGTRLTGPLTHEVTGSYSYIAPDGTLVAMEYIADENGYRAYPVRNNVVNPVVPPEPIPVPPPLRPVLNTPAPEIIRPIQTITRPTNVISPRPPLITQPIPELTIPVQTVRPPVQTIRPPFQTVRPVIQNVQVPVQTVRPPIQRPFQTVRPLIQTVQRPLQTVQRPIQTGTPRPILRPQVTPRPQFTSTFVNRPTFATFGTDNLGRRVIVDYDYGDLDYAASDPALVLKPPEKTDD